MLKRFVLVAICLIVLAGCAKKPSPTGGTVMSSGEIAFFYAPGWVVKKESGYWRFEHPDATAWAVVMVSDEQATTDRLIKLVEDELSKEWGEYTVAWRDTVKVQGRDINKAKYHLYYYLTSIKACGAYYSGREGSIFVVTYVQSGQEWAIQETMDNFLKGIAFKNNSPLEVEQ